MTRIGRERGWGPITAAALEQSCSPAGHLIIGTAEEVAEKIVKLHQLFGNTRIMIQMAIGTVAHAEVMKAIELMGTKVAPMVRGALD
jgi:alkanesulfonate monooxygenase SsuD/methylene tetrahydromethanopterin reductase-like flavin-dependent oxidoreductase (luciferase family)